jgi:hypothetical protein
MNGYSCIILLDLVDKLDLSEILISALAKDLRGERPLTRRCRRSLPRSVRRCCCSTPTARGSSSRKIDRAYYEDSIFRLLTGNHQPDHSQISEFSSRNFEALKGLFDQILRPCQKSGIVFNRDQFLGKI